MARKRSTLYLTNKGLQLDLSAHALSKLFARYEIFKMVLNLPGDIVDCGVYRGASLFSWGNLKPHEPDKSQSVCPKYASDRLSPASISQFNLLQRR
jgi:hypothetical protein